MLKHDWPIPENVAIAITNRFGGVSVSPFDSLNLGLHVGDKPQDVLTNRAILSQQFALPAEPTWLEQVHGTNIVELQTLAADSALTFADGSYSNQFGHVCAVMTADCLPILLCNQQGTEVAAVHAGWRGLCEGVIEQALAMFQSPAATLIAYFGPAIGPSAFEVGSEVRDAFISKDPQASKCFVPDRKSVV